MTIPRLVYHGDPVLHAPCQAVPAIDAAVRQLIDDLADTLYSTTGVGLAAPQIGVNKRVFIFDPFRVAGRRNYQALVNPRITLREGTVVSERESCLSAPALHVDVPRASSVHVEGLDAAGKPVSFEASGFVAIVVQHEMDHLDGRLVSDLLEGERRAEYERLLARVVQQHTSAWYVENLSAVKQRLDPVMRRPDGVLHAQRKAGHDVVVEKTGSLVEMSVRARTGDHGKRVVGLLDLLAPLDLLQLEAQAMMLSLLWTHEPARICLVGFGGGRVPMVFHQHYPAAVIDAVEPDPEMIVLARRYFGIQLDDRLKAIAADGREYLDRLADVKYDAILLDRDRAGMRDPYGMSTREFYEICKSHLTNAGVVVSTFSTDEFLSRERVMTFAASFAHVFQFRAGASQVIFGSDAAYRDRDALERIEEHYIPRNFTVRELAGNLLPLALEQADVNFGSILLDADRHKLAQDLSRDDSLFSGTRRNDPCPCGSGKKFKKCHGR